MYKLSHTRKKSIHLRVIIPMLLLLVTISMQPLTQSASAYYAYNSSFGNNGLVESYFSAPNLVPKDIDRFSDGSIAVVSGGVGDTYYESDLARGWFMSKYTPKGQLDVNFGESGMLFIPSSDYGSPDFVRTLPDKSMIVAGYGQFGSMTRSSGVIIKIQPDGIIDTHFGNNGFIGMDVWYSGIRDIAIQTDGKILVLGDLTVKRYLSNGIIDQQFGINGQTDFSSAYISAHSTYFRQISLQSDGYIIVGGESTSSDVSLSSKNKTIALQRFSPSGQLDINYGKGGIALNNVHYSGCSFYDIFTYEKDTTVVGDCGESGIQPPHPPILIRFNYAGVKDPNFNPEIDTDSSTAWRDSLHMSTDGKLYFGTTNREVYRLLANGQPDTTFNGSGKIQFSMIGSIYDYAFDDNGIVAMYPAKKASSKSSSYIGGIGLANVLYNDGEGGNGDTSIEQDHDTSFRPSTNGFGFNNTGTKELSGDLFLQYFGKTNIILPNGEWRESSSKFYHDIYQWAADGGNCYGMSATSIVNYLKLNQTASGAYTLPYHTGYTGITSIDTVPSNSSQTLRDIVGYYQGMQWGLGGTAYENDLISRGSSFLSDYLQSIKNSIDIDQPIVITIHGENKNEQRAGHALVAYRYESNNDQTKVYVYDVNYQKDDGRYINFYNNGNDWEYELSPVIKWGTNFNKNGLQIVSENFFTKQGLLPGSDWRNGIIVVPSFLTAQEDGSDLNTLSTLKQTEYIPKINSIGDNPLISTETFTLPIDITQSLDIKNATGEDDLVTLYGKNGFTEVNGAAPTIGSQSRIDFINGGKSVAITPSNNIAEFNVLIDHETPSGSYVYAIKSDGINKDESTFYEVDEGINLLIKNNGKAHNYSLTVSEKGFNNQSQALKLFIPENSSARVETKKWDNLATEPLMIYVDEHNDGTIDSVSVTNAILINGGASTTLSGNVGLNLNAPFAAVKMRIDDKPFDGSSKKPHWSKYSSISKLHLSGKPGLKTVYVQFLSADGTKSDIYSDSIRLE